MANQDYSTSQQDDPGLMPDEWVQGGQQDTRQDEEVQGSQDQEDQGILVDQEQFGQQDDVTTDDQWQQDHLEDDLGGLSGNQE